jgi:hypothetical protein
MFRPGALRTSPRMANRWQNAEDVKCLRVENGKAVFEVGSGIYHFGSAMVSVQEVSSPAVTQVTESNLK